MTRSEKHLLKAPLRWWRSRGFGIHPPFAYGFVDEVVRERNAYYAYAPLHCVAAEIRRLKKVNRQEKRPEREISEPAARMLLRTGAKFDWRNALVIGQTNGLAESALCMLHSEFRLFVAGKGPANVFDAVVAPFCNRISFFSDVSGAADAYMAESSSKPALVVNHIQAGDEAVVTGVAATVLACDGVVVVRNVHKNAGCSRLDINFRKCLNSRGAWFASGKASIFVGLGYLPSQHYLINLPL